MEMAEFVKILLDKSRLLLYNKIIKIVESQGVVNHGESQEKE